MHQGALPNQESLRERDIRHHFHPMTNPAKHERVGPTIVTGGEGCYFVGDDGKRYLDMHAGLWCTSLGLSEKRLRDAAVRQFDQLPYMQTFAHKTTEPVVMLAETLTRLAPMPGSKVQFQCSGSEANDTAVKFAWYYWTSRGQPNRRKIIARTKAYHGTTTVAASLTHLPHMHQSFGLPLPGFLHTSHPDIYRGMAEHESESQYATRLVDELESLIVKEGPETIAAFFAEPVMGAGGLFIPPETYFAKVQELLRRYEILFVADEVICGFGRTGRWWGSETYDLQPDILTCAKALSAAYLPISATMISENVYSVIRAEGERLGSFGHGYTYGGHPICAAVANEAIRIYEDDGLIGRASRTGAHLEAKLRALEDHPLVGNVRGVGLMWGVELVKDKTSKASFDPKLQIGVELSDICYSRGVNTRSLGPGVMTFSPPLIVTESEINDAVGKFTESLDELYSKVSKDGRLN